MKDALVSVACAGAGLAIALCDLASRSDDAAQVTLALLLGAGFLAGFARPERVWRWALLIGPWLGIVHAAARFVGRSHGMDPDTYATAAVLLGIGTIASFVGAWIAAGARHFIPPPGQPER